MNDPEKLQKAIEIEWGLHSSHAKMYRDVLSKISSLESEVETLKKENAKLKVWHQNDLESIKQIAADRMIITSGAVSYVEENLKLKAEIERLKGEYLELSVKYLKDFPEDSRVPEEKKEDLKQKCFCKKQSTGFVFCDGVCKTE